ncbi:MAG: lysophospholipid acyltransferase family protein [bacterium]
MRYLYLGFLAGRSSLFFITFILTTIIFGIISPLFLPLSEKLRHQFARSYSVINLFLLRWICGIRYKVTGQNNIPYDQTFIIMANHQSTWETLAFATIFPRITWVLKKELLNIPFFGWGLRNVNPIAIDRKAGRLAIEQVKQQGKARLESGLNIVVFPEGTRVLPKQRVNYKKGGASLAKYANVNVLPVAHNAGDYWARQQFIKKPGMINVHIGELIQTQPLDETALNQQVKTWIQSEQKKIADQG